MWVSYAYGIELEYSQVTSVDSVVEKLIDSTHAVALQTDNLANSSQLA